MPEMRVVIHVIKLMWLLNIIFSFFSLDLSLKRFLFKLVENLIYFILFYFK